MCVQARAHTGLTIPAFWPAPPTSLRLCFILTVNTWPEQEPLSLSVNFNLALLRQTAPSSDREERLVCHVALRGTFGSADGANSGVWGGGGVKEGLKERPGEGRQKLCVCVFVCVSEGMLGGGRGVSSSGGEGGGFFGDRTGALLTRQGQRPKDMKANFHFLKGRLESKLQESGLGAAPPPLCHFDLSRDARNWIQPMCYNSKLSSQSNHGNLYYSYCHCLPCKSLLGVDV